MKELKELKELWNTTEITIDSYWIVVVISEEKKACGEKRVPPNIGC